jgi:hypothetical protein
MEDIDTDRLIMFAVLAACACAIWGSFRWVLEPLDRAAKNRRCPFQFGLADLLCLFVLVQLPIGIVHRVTQGCDFIAVVVLDITMGTVTTLLWWTGVMLLSRAGVYLVWRRCIVLAVVLPCMIIANILPFVALAPNHRLWLLALIPIVGLLYALGRFTRTIVASAQKESESQDKNAAKS